MFQLILLLAILVSSEAMTYGKKAPSIKQANSFVDWVLDGEFWKASSGRFGLSLKGEPARGLGVYRVFADRVISGRTNLNPSQPLAVSVSRPGYALLDFNLQSAIEPQELNFSSACVDAVHQYQTDVYQSYYFKQEGNVSRVSTLSSLAPNLPVFVNTVSPNCAITVPGAAEVVEVLGGGRGDSPKSASFAFRPSPQMLLDKSVLTVAVDGSFSLRQNAKLDILWTANAGSYHDLWFHADLVFPDDSELALSSKKLLPTHEVSHTFPVHADWINFGAAILRMRLSREGDSEVIKESVVSLKVEHSGGLRLQEQLARLVTQSAQTQVSPILRFSQAQASTGFVSAPNEFLPGLLDSIRLSVSGAGVQTMSMTFSGDTSSARISLGLGTTPTIRLEYLDTAGDIIKVGSRSVSVSLSMPPVVLEPVPGPLPELIVSHQSGYFVSPMQVDFSASGTDIVYTTDATDPKSSSSAQRVSDFLSLPVSESVTVLAFVEKDGQKSGTRRYVYNKETIPDIEPTIENPERFLNGYFDTQLRILFPAIPDRPLVKLWLNGEEKNLPFGVTLTESVTAEYKAISERGFSNTTPMQMELTRVSVYHDLFHTIHSPSVGNLFAGTASVEFLSPETGYRFMYTTDETVPVTGALEVPLPFTLDIDRTTVMLGYLIHPSGLKSDLIQKRFTQAPLPDPDNIIRDFSVTEDQELFVDLLSLGVDPDLVISEDISPLFGTLSINGHEITYTPDPDYFGQDAFSIEFLHPSGLFLQLGFLVEVQGVNDAPQVFGDMNPITNEDEAIELDFLVFDPDFDDLDIQISQDPSQGTLFNTTDGLLFYEPAANFTGVDQFSLIASDLSTSIEFEFIVTVLPVNDAPILYVDPHSVMEDSSLTTQILAFDVEGDLLNYSLDSQPANGTAIMSTDGELVYVPNPDYHGVDAIMVTVSDGELEFTTDILVTVYPTNDAPEILLFSDSLYTNLVSSLMLSEDTTGFLYFNLVDMDGDFPEISLPILLSESTTTSIEYDLGTSSGFVRIEPIADFYGDIDLSITVCDQSALPPQPICTSTTAVLTYAPVNDAPQFFEVYSLASLEDSFVSTSVMAFDLDGDSLSYFLLSQPAYGIATVFGDGSLTYTPNPNYFGPDFFVVMAEDASATTTETQIDVWVEGVDDAPEIHFYSDAWVTPITSSFYVDEDEEVSIHFEVVDLDGHFASLSLTPTVDTSSVSLAVFSTDGDVTGQIVITPEPDFFGTAMLSVTACDTSTAVTEHLCTTASVEIEFLPVNDAPEFLGPVVLSGLEDSLVTTELMFFDIEGDSVSFLIVTAPLYGVASVTTSGVLTYVPDSDYFGSDTIGISVIDSFGATGFGQIELTIDPKNDAPVLSLFMDSVLSDPYTTQEFIEDTVGMLYYSYLDPESHSISIDSTDVLTGMLEFEVYATGVTTGYLILNPYTDWHGGTQISLSACDSTTLFPGSLCTTSVIDLNFLPINDEPFLMVFSDPGFTFATSVVSLLEDSTTAIYFTTWDSEMDAVTVTYLADAGAAGSFMITDSSLWFTPSTNWNGVQTAALEICDVTTVPPGSLCSLVPLSFVVDPVNDAPIASFFSDPSRLVSTSGFEFLEDTLPSVFYSFVDAEGDLVSVTLLNALTSGSLAINTTAGTLTISVAPNFFGTDVAVLEFCDIAPATPPTLCSTYSLPILVHPVNDAPTITIIPALPVTGDEDSNVSFTFVIIDTELSPLNVTLSSAPTKGTVTFPVNAGGTGTYTPFPNENGADSFELSVSDSELTSQAVVTVQINPTPDAPVITWPDVASAIFVNTPYPLNPVVTDPDLPADTLSYFWTMTTSPFVGAGEINNPSSTEAFLFVTYPGSYQVELTVLDSFTLSDGETFNFVTKDDWVPTAANIGLPTTPVLITGSSFGKNLFFGWIGDDSRAEVRIQTASGWGTLSGTMATTIPAMVVRNHENQVYVAYRDASRSNNISVMHSPLLTRGLRRLGEPGMAVVTSSAFDMAVTRRGTPIVCYAKSQALAKPGCVYYDQYWHPMSEVSALPNFPNITLLKMVLNLDEQPIVIHYDGSAVRAHVRNNTAWASHGTVFTDSNVAQIEASHNGLQTYVLIRLNNGTTKVFMHTAAMTWTSLEDPDLVDSVHVSLLADGRGPVHIASVQNDGTARVIRFTGSGWENSMISPAGTFGPAMSILRKVGQPVLVHHQLNSVEPAVVRTLNSRMPMIVNATPSLGATKVETGMNLSLEWNRPLMAGSENFVGVTTKATPATTMAASTTYSETAGFVTTVNPSSNLAPDSTVLLRVATGISDMQGFGVPTDMFVPFTTRRITALIADAGFTAGEYPSSKDDYSIAIKPSGVGVDAKWVAWNRVSNQNLATKFHSTGSVWVEADSSVTGFGPTGSAYPQIAFFKDQAWLVAKDSTGMYAMSYNGTVWETQATSIAGAGVGVHQIVHKVGPRINAQDPGQYALTLRGSPYALQLYKQDHSDNTWDLVGGNIYNDISNHYDLTVLPNGNPVVAFVTQSAPDQVRVSIFDGSAWVAVTPNYPFIPGHDYTNIRIQNWGNHLSLAAIWNTSGTQSIQYNSYNMDVGGDYWTSAHQAYQSDIANFDMAIVDSVPYIFAVKSSPLYTPLLIRGGLPNTNAWEFSGDLLAGSGISNVADGKLAAHRGRLYLLYRDSSTYNLNGWFLEP